MAVLTKTWFDDRLGLGEISPLRMHGRYIYLDSRFVRWILWAAYSTSSWSSLRQWLQVPCISIWSRDLQNPPRGSDKNAQPNSGLVNSDTRKYKNTTWGIWKLILFLRWNGIELELSTYPPPPFLGFPGDLGWKSSIVFFWWDSDAQNESIHHVWGSDFWPNFLPEIQVFRYFWPDMLVH